MIDDFRFAVPDNIVISLPTVKPEGVFFVCLEGGISVRLYIRLIRYLSDGGSVDALKDIAFAIIREDPAHKNMTPDFFNANFNELYLLRSLVGMIIDALNELTADPELAKPIVQPKPDSGNLSADSAGQSSIVQDITYFCSKTAHTYDDVMRMPYVTFISMLKHLTHLEALKDPDYLEQYISQNKVDRLKRNAQKNKKLDLDGLKRLAASL